jgi:hypothetical protein
MKSTLVGGALCVAVGLGIGVCSARSSPTATEVADARVVRRVEPGAGMSRHEVATIVRAELARDRGVHAGNIGTPAPVRAETIDEARERMTAEQADNAERAARIVDDAIARGAWTEQHKRDLWSAVADVPGPVQREIFQSLGVAINNNRVRVETDGMPL